MDEVTVKEVCDAMAVIAPVQLAETYDNVGLMVGDLRHTVHKMIVGLELTDQLVDCAIENQVDMIVVHHPPIFSPIRHLKNNDPTDVIGGRLYRLIRHDIACYAAHTNLDRVDGGLNDYMIERLGLRSIETDVSGPAPILRVCPIEEQSLSTFVNHVKETLELDYILYTGASDKSIKTVAVCTGSGTDFLQDAKASGADVLLTGDLKYHTATMALDMGMAIIDATHYGTEVIVGQLLQRRLEEWFEGRFDIQCDRTFDNPIQCQ